MKEPGRESENAFFARLWERVPEFQRTAAEETAYFGELIPHLLMADFTRWLIETYRRGSAGDAVSLEVVDRALRFLESEFADDGIPEVQELIAASFLDNLSQAGPDRAGIKSHLGPRLLRQIQWSEGTRPR